MMRKNSAASQVIGFILVIVIALSLLASGLYITRYLVDRRVDEIAGLQAQAIANSIEDAIIDAVTVKRSLQDADYQRIIDIPQTLVGGRDYYVELTESYVYVNSTDGRISAKCTNYNAKNLHIGFSGKVYSGGGKIKVVCNRTEYIYKLDFGTPSSAEMGTGNNYNDYSPVEPGYIRVSNLSVVGGGKDWPTSLKDWKYRIPITINNTNITSYAQAGYESQSLNNYPILLSIASDTLYEHTDGSDLRFYDPVENKILPFWIESWNNRGVSRIWFSVNVEKNSTKTIYLYYGNPNAKTNGNGNAVFSFFDDFEPHSSSPTGDVDWSRWIGSANATCYNESGLTFLRLYGGQSIATSGKGGHAATMLIQEPDDPNPPEKNSTYRCSIVEAKMRLHASGTTDSSLFALRPSLLSSIDIGFPWNTSITLPDGSSKVISELDNYEGGVVYKVKTYPPLSGGSHSAQLFGNYRIGRSDYLRITTSMHSLVVGKDHWIYASYWGIWNWVRVNDIYQAGNWDKWRVKIWNGITFVDEQVQNVENVVKDEDYGDAYILWVNRSSGAAAGGWRNYIANGFVVGGYGATPHFSCYIVSSRHMAGGEHAFADGFGIWKAVYNLTRDESRQHLLTNCSDDDVIQNDAWYVIRSFFYCSKYDNGSLDYTLTFPSAARYIYEYGAMDSNLPTPKGPPDLSPPFNQSDSANDSAPGEPYISGEIGLGAGIVPFLFSKKDYVDVDWIRVRPYVIPPPRITIGTFSTINCGWNSSENLYSVDRTKPNPLVRDFVNSTDSKNFTITNLSPGNYSITITMGDNNASHDNIINVIIYGKGIHHFGPITIEAGNFSTLIAQGIEPDSDGNITIQFSDGDDTGWTVCAITIERGIRGVRLEYE